MEQVAGLQIRNMNRLIVGAKETSQPGWISTDVRAGKPKLDIRNYQDWLNYAEPETLDRILCEHVLEHLSVSDALKAIQNFCTFLKPNGFARIAVPDALNPNENYQEWCRPGGSGQRFFKTFIYERDEPDHQVHYNFQSLSMLIREVGLYPHPLEWFDSRGQFHKVAWRKSDGDVLRSYDSEYSKHHFLLGFQNLSLIIDAVKI